MNKVCCVFNYNPLYRYPIYKAMSEAFDCDFFFGDTVFEPIKQFDATQLKGFKGFIHPKILRFKGYIWHKGIWNIFKFRYTHYVVTGECRLLVNLLIFLWAKLLGRTFIIWTHGEHQTYSKWTTRLILKSFYRSADKILMYGSYNLNYMIDLGCVPNRIYTIHNSLDTGKHTELFGQMSISPLYKNYFGNDYPTVIYIGRLQKRKKIEQLIEAVASLKQKGATYNIVLVGDNTSGDYLYDVVNKYGMDKNVWFYGPSYKEEDNAELLYNAAVCVCPASVGLTAIHAMSYGCPVVSNDNMETQMPEFESIIEGETGSLFNENDVEDLMKKIEFWCKTPSQDREYLREKIRQHIIEDWSVDYQINVLKKVLR